MDVKEEREEGTGCLGVGEWVKFAGDGKFIRETAHSVVALPAATLGGVFQI